LYALTPTNVLAFDRTGELQTALGSARALDPTKNEAKLMVNFPFMGPLESPYWVLDTDYTGYSIVWSCRPAPDGVNSYRKSQLTLVSVIILSDHTLCLTIYRNRLCYDVP